MYHREWLKENIKSYLHDSSIDSELDTWIDLAAKRVSQILRCREMESELSRVTGDPDGFISLGSSVRQVLGVQWQSYAGSYVNLLSVPRHNAGQYKRNGQPCVYLVEDRKIYPLPALDSNYKAQVINEVEIPAGTTEVAALSAYPFVFLNAALAEAYDWKQNPDMLARYEDKWVTEAREVSKNYESEKVGDTPAMRGV